MGGPATRGREMLLCPFSHRGTITRMPKKIAIVGVSGVAVVCLLAWGSAWFVRARSEGDSGNCRSHLTCIDGVKQQWALEHKKTANDVPTWDDLRPYLPWGRVEHEIPVCPQGGKYIIGGLDERPKCSIGGSGHSI